MEERRRLHDARGDAGLAEVIGERADGRSRACFALVKAPADAVAALALEVERQDVELVLGEAVRGFLHRVLGAGHEELNREGCAGAPQMRGESGGGVPESPAAQEA